MTLLVIPFFNIIIYIVNPVNVVVNENKNLDEYKKNYSSINSIKDIKDATTFIPIFKSDRFITQNH